MTKMHWGHAARYVERVPFARYYLFGALVLEDSSGKSTLITQLSGLLEDEEHNWITPFVRHVSLSNLPPSIKTLDGFIGLFDYLTEFAPAFKSIIFTACSFHTGDRTHWHAFRSIVSRKWNFSIADSTTTSFPHYSPTSQCSKH
jgi:energy-coupling factor transporter ATP-binding protein EcfA2